MHCPSCQTDLVMSERQGIEIDYCPKCRGVWLDRGELDKIIERSLGGPSGGKHASVAGGVGLGGLAGKVLERATGQYRERKYDDDDDYRRGESYGYRKKKSWLKEIFD